MKEWPFCETIGDPELVLWGNRVKLRDNYTCQHCGSQEKEFLDPHHIKPIYLFQELKYDDDNGITYCMWCHAWEGHKDNAKVREKILARYAIKLHEKYVATDKETTGRLYPGNSQE